MAKDAASLLAQANCYACFGGGGTTRVLEVLLYQHWANAIIANLDPAVSAWVARAQANGGNPSTTSISAVNAMWLAVKAAGIDSKIIHLNPIAPDDYPTATTPLIVGPGGLNQWGDPSGRLSGIQNTLNLGLKGDPARQPGALFDTGVIPANTSLSALNGGVSVYVSVQEPDGTNHTHGGCDIGDGTNQIKLIYDFEFIAFTNAGSPNGFTANSNYGGTNNYPFSGFLSASCIPSPAGWVIGAYGNVNNVSKWATFTNLPSTSGGGTTPIGTIPTTYSFGFLDGNGQSHEASAETISFAAFHQGLTFAQASSLYTAVQAMRVAMGGGYV